MGKPEKFSSLSDAIQSATYLDTLRQAEYQWIQTRLAWLFISQSFCISAFIVLSIALIQGSLESRTISILKLGIPVFGVVSCVVVGVAALAASRVARRLAAERRSALQYISENTPLNIPGGIGKSDPSVSGWTYWAGELPHRVLPWALATFWLLQLVG
jgi:hypothetical protein